MKNNLKKNLMSALLVVLTAGAVLAEEAYPVAVLDRPGVLPIGAVEGVVDFNNKGLDLGHSDVKVKAKVGVGSKIQIDLGYDGAAKGSFEASKLNHTAHVGARASLMSVGSYGNSISFDVPLHFAGQLVENTKIGFTNAYMITNNFAVLALHGDFLDVKYGKKLGLEVNLPVMAAFQASENVYLELGTNLATFNAREFDKSNYIWTKTPVGLGVTYAFNNVIDLSAKVGVEDALNAKKTFNAGVGVAFRAGNLLG